MTSRAQLRDEYQSQARARIAGARSRERSRVPATVRVRGAETSERPRPLPTVRSRMIPTARGVPRSTVMPPAPVPATLTAAPVVTATPATAPAFFGAAESGVPASLLGGAGVPVWVWFAAAAALAGFVLLRRQ